MSWVTAISIDVLTFEDEIFLYKGFCTCEDWSSGLHAHFNTSAISLGGGGSKNFQSQMCNTPLLVAASLEGYIIWASDISLLLFIFASLGIIFTTRDEKTGHIIRVIFFKIWTYLCLLDKSK